MQRRGRETSLPTAHMPPERALELFLQQLCSRAAELAQQRGANSVTPSHL